MKFVVVDYKYNRTYIIRARNNIKACKRIYGLVDRGKISHDYIIKRISPNET